MDKWWNGRKREGAAEGVRTCWRWAGSGGVYLPFDPQLHSYYSISVPFVVH